ncbi:MAG: dehydrogenase subunit, partial [Candidatus Krumholzibacteriota bacterium]|nr:dehydrogenase subunit [Candidatus Krumholzibacteriota bacterium]
MTIHLIGLGKALFIWGLALMCVPVLIWFERKGAAFIQDRVGPNRAAILGVRLAGFVHNISDVVKLLTKEMMIPAHTNKWYFALAPFIGITVILFAFAVIPWADNLRFGSWDIPMQVTDLNGGILFILAIISLEVYGVVLAGWASNNKFSLLGGLRSTAQMVSYEVPLALSLIGVFMVFGTVRLGEIVTGQGELLFGFLPKWGLFVQPLGFILFLTSVFAETNRNPFDLPEGESEIVAG